MSPVDLSGLLLEIALDPHLIWRHGGIASDPSNARIGRFPRGSDEGQLRTPIDYIHLASLQFGQWVLLVL